METQVESLKKERDKYRTHRDELVDMAGSKVKDVMEQHMKISSISESFIHTEENSSEQDSEISEIANKGKRNGSNNRSTRESEPKISE